MRARLALVDRQHVHLVVAGDTLTATVHMVQASSATYALVCVV